MEMTEKSEYNNLLGRELFAYYPVNRFEDTRIVITGAGGSIGSHLVKSLLEKTNSHLILIDQNENALYQLLFQISEYRTRIQTLLSDIQNRKRMQLCFQEYRPQMVIHTAAYKQVPMLEIWPAAAVVNNIRNTELVYELAVESGVEKFIFISTDKVFSCSNVLGKTKKIAEYIICSIKNSKHSTILRFGNVLYSSGSASELFRNQIRGNKKLTITDPDSTRYFIAPEEASDFILFAMNQVPSASIYYMFQDKQIRILELAQRMYRRFYQAEPENEWWEKIHPRPGDILSEFDLKSLNDVTIKSNPMIRKITDLPIEVDRLAFQNELLALYQLAETSCSPEEIKDGINRLISLIS
jgi:FlaA1/EpsC-like NDP-sugar epimerase